MDGSWINIVWHVCRTFYHVCIGPLSCPVLSCLVSSVFDTTLLATHSANDAHHASRLLHVASGQISKASGHSIDRARSNQYVFNIATLPQDAIPCGHSLLAVVVPEDGAHKVHNLIQSRPLALKFSTIDTWLIVPLPITLYHRWDCKCDALYNKMYIHKKHICINSQQLLAL